MNNPLDLITAAKARRAAGGLVSNNGIACPTKEWVEYYNLRECAQRDEAGRVLKSPALVAAKAAAVASTSA